MHCLDLLTNELPAHGMFGLMQITVRARESQSWNLLKRTIWSNLIEVILLRLGCCIISSFVSHLKPTYVNFGRLCLNIKQTCFIFALALSFSSHMHLAKGDKFHVCLCWRWHAYKGHNYPPRPICQIRLDRSWWNHTKQKLISDRSSLRDTTSCGQPLASLKSTIV